MSHQILEGLGRRRLAAGEFVFAKGDEGDCAYLIEEGEVEVIDPETGLAFGIVGKGEIFGEIALIDGHPRSATVRTARDTLLVEIKRSLLEELLHDTNPIVRVLLKVILERYRTNIWHRPKPVDHHAPMDPLQAEVIEKLTLLKDMRDALDRNEFELFYQPIVTLPGNQIAGFEALIRWRHPERGLIPPNKFLGIAEETGLIRLIGNWTIEQACRDWLVLRTVATAEKRFISINLSGKQLTDPNFAQQALVTQMLTGVTADEVKFELTETSLIANPTLANLQLSVLKSCGNVIALDDYGTGYSGLSHLKDYPFGVLKLDQTFVREILTSNLSLRLVANSIEMAKSLQMGLVAEGIESLDIANSLAEMKCDYAQGYYFGKPQPLSAWIKKPSEE